jgi:hypothetical protein
MNNAINNAVIEAYLALVAAYLANSTDANVDAVEAFENENPGVADAAYKAGGPYTYDPVAGVVYS